LKTGDPQIRPQNLPTIIYILNFNNCFFGAIAPPRSPDSGERRESGIKKKNDNGRWKRKERKEVK